LARWSYSLLPGIFLKGVSPMSDPAVLRLLDAAANRAREALRVLEDFARFVLDDAAISAELKQLRHEVSAVSAAFHDAVFYRDTPGDVGVANKVPDELNRDDAGQVVIAAGKRLGEALRSIAEYAKIDHPVAAARFEAMRYRFYDIERRLRIAACPRDRFSAVRLYVIVTESICRRPWLETAALAIDGGADCIQLRESELQDVELLDRARRLVALCRSRGVVSIVNNRPDIALAAGADGVHVGQEDLPAVEARRIVGSSKLIGVSTHRMGQARQALSDGADYIGVGPFFRSPTKPRSFVAGPGYAREIAEWNHLSAVAIAGITAVNVDEVLATGMRSVAVCAAVIGADDPVAAAAAIRRRLIDWPALTTDQERPQVEVRTERAIPSAGSKVV
jgi:thiamine-phosphate pyrophosphorylase